MTFSKARVCVYEVPDPPNPTQLTEDGTDGSAQLCLPVSQLGCFHPPMPSVSGQLYPHWNTSLTGTGYVPTHK